MNVHLISNLPSLIGAITVVMFIFCTARERNE